MRRAIVSLLLLGAFLLFSPQAVLAAQFVSNNEVHITKDVPDDLYVVGSRIVVSGNVAGDLFAFGQQIVVEGTVDGDAMLFGQVITVRGEVKDDVRAAGMIVDVRNAAVGGDVLAAGNTVVISPTGSVAGDVAVGGDRIYVGNVAGNLWAAGTGIAIAGHIGGDVRVSAEGTSQGGPSAFWTLFAPGVPADLPTVNPGLTLLSSARVDGNLTYRSPQPAAIAEGAVVRGEVTHELPEMAPQEREKPEEQWGTLPWLAEQARYWLTLFLVGVAAFVVGGERWRHLSTFVTQQPLPALGWGVALFLGVLGVVFVLFLAAILAAVVFGLLTLRTLAVWALILGLTLDLVLALGYVVYTTLLAPSVVGYALFSRVDRGKFTWVLWVAVSLLLYVFLGSLPYVGWIVKWVVALFALGALWLVWREARKTRIPSAAET